MRKHAPLAIAALIAALAVVSPAAAGTLENMERERAIALDTLLAPETAAADRLGKVAMSKARLNPGEGAVALAPMIDPSDALAGGISAGGSDREAVPLVRIQPDYPMRARQRRWGHCKLWTFSARSVPTRGGDSPGGIQVGKGTVCRDSSRGDRWDTTP